MGAGYRGVVLMQGGSPIEEVSGERADVEVFYAAPQRLKGETILLDPGETHHMTRVARLRPGDEVLIADGCGTMHRARFDGMSGKEARCTVLEHLRRMNEPSRSVTLAQALLRNPGRMDWSIEKSVELGAGRIIPMRTERSIPSAAKTERWREIARAAMKQSRRCVWPEISEIRSFRDALTEFAGHALYLLHESSSDAATFESESRDAAAPVVLFVGPEGGFSAGEIDMARDAGADIVTLGARRLRSETAAAAALARMKL